MSDSNILFPNETIFDGDHFEVHQDWEVPIVGFFIISAKRSIRSITEFTPEESTEFMKILQMVRNGQEALGIKDVYLFQNEDTSHNFHFWMFPRHSWMESFGRKIQSVRPIMNYAVENMSTPEGIEEVKKFVEAMKQYLVSAELL